MGVGSSSQPQPVCSQLMDRRTANGWELRGGTPLCHAACWARGYGGAEGVPRACPGVLSIPTAQHPAGFWGAMGVLWGCRAEGGCHGSGAHGGGRSRVFFPPGGGFVGLCAGSIWARINGDGFHMGRLAGLPGRMGRPWLWGAPTRAGLGQRWHRAPIPIGEPWGWLLAKLPVGWP